MSSHNEDLPDDIEDPMPSPLAAGANAFHESYLELVKAGFNRGDALYLLAASIVVREQY